MLKKTLLSLAITASTAGLTACNISSISDNNEVDSSPVTAGAPGVAISTARPIFSAASGQLPLQIDILFAAAATTDGTASVTDTSPVTSALNDLAGFSATSTIDIAFNAPLDEASIAAGSSVWLVEFKSKEDSPLIDSLDLKSILAVAPTAPFADQPGDQLIPDVDYVAEYVEMDNGATPTIRVHPLKPLDPKTKYMVVVTDKLKDKNGNSAAPSVEYDYLLGDDALVSDALGPVRTAVKGWNSLAQAFLSQASPSTGVVLSYTFTTEANDDILLSMAAPENYVFGLFADTVGLEKAVGEDTVNAVIAGVAAALNAGNAANPNWVVLDPATPAGKLAVRKTADYQTQLANSVAESLVGEAGVTGIISAVQEAVLGAGEVADTAAEIGAVKLSKIYASTLQSAAANGAAALLKTAADRPSAREFVPIRTDVNTNGTVAASEIIPVQNTDLGLPNKTISVQGMLTLPQFMKRKDATDTDSFGDFWKGSRSVGAVIDQAFGNPTTTTPPKDGDGSLNVTYRFPFAQKVEDVKVPVLVTYPLPQALGGACPAPADGWPVVIFQHGITTDRTASLGFANGMAASATGCFATVAMDLPTHGVDASTTDRNGAAKRYAAFNGFNVAGYVDATDPSKTPFAATLAALAEANVDTYAGLQERHGNLALDAQQKPTPMVFTAGSESGNSGDFFINLGNMQQTRDHIRQGVMDLMNLNASLENIGDAIKVDLTGNETADLDGKLDTDKVFFVGHSLGAITGMTFAAVNNAVAKNDNITDKDVNPLQAVAFANPGGQLPKLLENSPSFSAKILPGLAASAGLTQGMSDLEKFFGVFQAPLDSADPINFTDLLKSTNTPVLMFEMVGGGLVNEFDSNLVAPTAPGNPPVTGLPDTLIAAGGYPADTVVPNNANPALGDVETGLSYLAGTDPLVKQLGLTTVGGSIALSTDNLMLVSKFKEGTHGTISSADAYTVFAEMIKQTASFFQTSGKGIVVGDDTKLQVPAAE